MRCCHANIPDYLSHIIYMWDGNDCSTTVNVKPRALQSTMLTFDIRQQSTGLMFVRIVFVLYRG